MWPERTSSKTSKYSPLLNLHCIYKKAPRREPDIIYKLKDIPSISYYLSYLKRKHKLCRTYKLFNHPPGKNVEERWRPLIRFECFVSLIQNKIHQRHLRTLWCCHRRRILIRRNFWKRSESITVTVTHRPVNSIMRLSSRLFNFIKNAINRFHHHWKLTVRHHFRRSMSEFFEFQIAE